MRTSLLVALLLSVAAIGCGGKKTESQEFQSNLEKAAEAAEKGKELVKSPTKGKR